MTDLRIRITGKTLRQITALLPEAQAEVAVNLMPGPMRKVADFLRIPMYAIDSDSLISAMADLPIGTIWEIWSLLFNCPLRK